MKVYTPIEAKQHTPPYKIHRYFSRRPWNVFKQIIETFSDKGDIILDPFCGGGVTLYEGLKLGNKVVGFDLNPLSIFIVKNMIKNSYDKKELNPSYENIKKYLIFLYSNYNSVEFVSDQKTIFNKLIPIEWNEVAWLVKCNHCNEEIILSNNNRIKQGQYSCSNHSCNGNKKNKGYIKPINCERIGHKYLYSVSKSPIEKKKWLLTKFDNNREKEIEKHISFLENELKNNDITINRDKIPLKWDRQHEDLLFRKNIKTFQDFFTRRNLFINSLLLNYIKKLNVSQKTYEILRLVFSSSLRDTNIMVFTNAEWQSGKPTSWSKHAYWLPNQFCEVNVIDAFRRAFNRYIEALEYNSSFNYSVKMAKSFNDLSNGSNILLYNDTIEKSDIPDNSIDCIITDPPYGSNVQYLELSHFWYPWNKDIYENKELNYVKEAVANRKKGFEGSKDIKDYEDNLFLVFQRCYDVLKPGKNMILTFNNKHLGPWFAILISIIRSGFTLRENGIYFQTGIKNYKQTAHTKYKGSPYGDFIYVFEKNNIANNMENIKDEKDLFEKMDQVVAEHLEKITNVQNSDRNDIILDMVLESIPLIQSFIYNNPDNGTNHKLYSNLNGIKKLF